MSDVTLEVQFPQHGYTIQLISEIVKADPEKNTVVCRFVFKGNKLIRAVDHLIDKPVMPGVMMAQVMINAVTQLIPCDLSPQEKAVQFLREVRDLTFDKVIGPDSKLLVKAKVFPGGKCLSWAETELYRDDSRMAKGSFMIDMNHKLEHRWTVETTAEFSGRENWRSSVQSMDPIWQLEAMAQAANQTEYIGPNRTDRIFFFKEVKSAKFLQPIPTGTTLLISATCDWSLTDVRRGIAHCQITNDGADKIIFANAEIEFATTPNKALRQTSSESTD